MLTSRSATASSGPAATLPPEEGRVPASTYLLGESPVMQRVRRDTEALARLRRTTLVTGPTGTGKEMVARALHAHGQPRDAPFVVVHCGTLPDTLAEDELFGHARGAFTGARDMRGGLVRASAGGTLFLDEIDSLSRRAQASLLRFLESGEVRSVGSDRVEKVGTWVVAATNCDLAEAARSGAFRADLLYRLDVMRVDLPALALRAGDVEQLAWHFLHGAGGTPRGFAPCALKAMRSHGWPGNVRELKHRVERAALLSDRELLRASDLELGPHDAADEEPPKAAAGLAEVLWQLVEVEGFSLNGAVALCESTIIDRALQAAGGNRTRAADRLGIHVRTLFKKLSRN